MVEMALWLSAVRNTRRVEDRREEVVATVALLYWLQTEH